MPEAQHFVERHLSALQPMPVALFAVCMTMAEDTAHSRLTVLGYLDPVLDMLPNVEDEDVGLFAGAFDPTLWSPLYRMLLKRSRILLYGDFRRWDLVEKWTEYIDGHILRRRERESA
jgi:menaquinone-dependent protoporphyrinogen IX oxidase